MREPTGSQTFEVGEAFARILTETTRSLVCVLDREGRILLFNEACERATGFSREEVIGRDARDLVIPPEEREAFGEFLTYVWRTGTPSPQVGHWQTKQGRLRLIAWSNHPMAGRDGRPQSLVTTGIDLTDREDRDRGAGDLTPDPEAELAEIGRLATEQRALRRVATLVASEVSPERVFTAVSEGCARVLEVNASTVVRYEGDGTATVLGRHNRDNIDVFRVGESIRTDEDSALGRVAATAAPPIVVAGVLWGSVAIASEDPLPADSENRLGAFCELASLAVASAQARADLIASRARVVRAGDEQRRRLERNLHDGAQQRLVSVALMLRLAKARLGEGSEEAATLLDGASRELDTGLAELREIARGLHPAVLTDHGLLRALEALTARLPIPVEIEAALDERPPAEVEATAYYVLSEALANVARHAEAEAARVTIRREPGAVRLEVADDGRGGADESAGTGIVGLRDRAEAAGGTLGITSPPGRGTVVAAVLPLP